MNETGGSAKPELCQLCAPCLLHKLGVCRLPLFGHRGERGAHGAHHHSPSDKPACKASLLNTELSVPKLRTDLEQNGKSVATVIGYKLIRPNYPVFFSLLSLSILFKKM